MARALDTSSSRARLSRGLGTSSSRLRFGLAGVLRRGRLDGEALAGLEEQLLLADLGPAMAQRLLVSLRAKRFAEPVEEVVVRQALAEAVAEVLRPVEGVLPGGADGTFPESPYAVVLLGVNGSGKTTLAAKLAVRWRDAGAKVLLVACDSFRAAASEQLEVLARRGEIAFRAAPARADPASLAYAGLEAAAAEGFDVVVFDTAGRLHNRTALVDELRKLVRVLGKCRAGAPHASFLVLDATTGLNAVRQAEVFGEAAAVKGLFLNKLDGTARGGALVSIADSLRIPVLGLGVGEASEDLVDFNARRFAFALLGLDEEG